MRKNPEVKAGEYGRARDEDLCEAYVGRTRNRRGRYCKRYAAVMIFPNIGVCRTHWKVLTGGHVLSIRLSEPVISTRTADPAQMVLEFPAQDAIEEREEGGANGTR